MRVQLTEELWNEIYCFNRDNGISESYHLNNIYIYAHFDDEDKVFEFCTSTEAPLKAKASDLHYFDSVKFAILVEEEDGLRELEHEHVHVTEVHACEECKSC